MATLLSTWPYILFAILEPISECVNIYFANVLRGHHSRKLRTDKGRTRVAGWYLASLDPRESVASQHPNVPIPETLPTASETVARQLGNMYLLMALMGVAILSSTSEPKVLRNYFIALAIGDLGHLYVTYLGTGWLYFVDISQWNAMAWGNIGVTSFLLVNRLAYFLGMFGGMEVSPVAKKVQ